MTFWIALASIIIEILKLILSRKDPAPGEIVHTSKDFLTKRLWAKVRDARVHRDLSELKDFRDTLKANKI